MWYCTFFLTSNDSAPRNPQIYVSLCYYRLTSWKPRLYATRWTPCGTKPSPTVESQRKTCTARHSGKYLGFFFFTFIHPSLFCPAGQVFYKTFLISPINHRSLHPLISTFSFCLCSSFHRARRSRPPHPLIHPVYQKPSKIMPSKPATIFHFPSLCLLRCFPGRVTVTYWGHSGDLGLFLVSLTPCRGDESCALCASGT